MHSKVEILLGLAGLCGGNKSTLLAALSKALRQLGQLRLLLLDGTGAFGGGLSRRPDRRDARRLDAAFHWIISDAEHIILQLLLAFHVRANLLCLLLALHVASDLRFDSAIGLKRAFAALSFGSCTHFNVSDRSAEELRALVLLNIISSGPLVFLHKAQTPLKRDALLHRCPSDRLLSGGLALLHSGTHDVSSQDDLFMIVTLGRFKDKAKRVE